MQKALSSRRNVQAPHSTTLACQFTLIVRCRINGLDLWHADQHRECPNVQRGRTFAQIDDIRFPTVNGPGEWAASGLVQAFIISLYAEMYGFPLTIYLLVRYFGLDRSHLNVNLWRLRCSAWATPACCSR